MAIRNLSVIWSMTARSGVSVGNFQVGHHPVNRSVNTAMGFGSSETTLRPSVKHGAHAAKESFDAMALGH